MTCDLRLVYKFVLFLGHRHHLLAGIVDEAVEVSFPHEGAAVAVETEFADFVILRVHDLLASAIHKPLEPEYLHHCPAGPVFVKRLYVRIFRGYDHCPMIVFETVVAVALEFFQAMMRNRRGCLGRCGQW